jgi:SAM-dependent methyltransferase
MIDANAYWGRAGLGAAILDAVAAAGKDLDALSVADLAAFDNFHSGGRNATLRLARLARLAPGERVLDVGGGLGGPARILAAEFGCDVTIVDLTDSYLEAAQLLNRRLGLDDRVHCLHGDALALPVERGGYDVVWTQNSGMGIADKERLYAGFHAALRPHGRLATQEPMAGDALPLLYPEMWARNASESALRTPSAMRATIEAAGFALCAWEDVTAETLGPKPDSAGARTPPASIQALVMGEALPKIMATSYRNRTEGRLALVQAVFDRH